MALLLITGDRGLAGAYNATSSVRPFDEIHEWEGARR
jgi:F0F1-type ATP synthase gamma subunit